MNVKWYRDTTLLADENYTVDSANYFCDTPVQAYNKVVITIGNMTKANRFLKIFNIADGITRQFYNDEIENASIIEQITTNNQAININEATMHIFPRDNTGVIFQRTLPFSIYRNDMFFGRFYIDTSTSNTNKTLYDIKVSDYIKVLESQTYLGGIYSNTLMSTIVADILGDIPYSIDATASAYHIDGYLPIMDKREALRQLAFATNSYINTSRTNVIEIKPLPTTVSRAIPKSEILSINTTQSNITTKITLKTTSLVTKKNVATDDLFQGKINGKTTMVIFEKPVFNLTIDGGTINESNCNYAIITGTASTTTLTGKEYQQSEFTQTKDNSFVVSTDIPKEEIYETTLTCSDIDIMNLLNFVEYTITSDFKMGTTRVGDLVQLNGQNARVVTLSYDLAQTEIYAKGEFEAYYE